MVRVEKPRLGPGRVMEQLAPWENFQVLGPHGGVDICSNNSMKRYVNVVHVVVFFCFFYTRTVYILKTDLPSLSSSPFFTIATGYVCS